MAEDHLYDEVEDLAYDGRTAKVKKKRFLAGMVGDNVSVLSINSHRQGDNI